MNVSDENDEFEVVDKEDTQTMKQILLHTLMKMWYLIVLNMIRYELSLKQDYPRRYLKTGILSLNKNYKWQITIIVRESTIPQTP